MPFEFTWEPDGVFLSFCGALTEEEVSASAKAVFEDPRWPSCRYYIADARDADFDDLTLDGLKSIAARYRVTALKNTDVSGVAILSSLLARGLAHAYSVAGGKWSLYVADDEEDAREHLGLDPLDFG